MTISPGLAAGVPRKPLLHLICNVFVIEPGGEVAKIPPLVRGVA